MTPSDGKPIFNYYVAQGYNYYFGDDLDLWITSDPFHEGNLDFGAVVKHKPVTPDQMKLALDLLAAIRDLSTRTTAGEITGDGTQDECQGTSSAAASATSSHEAPSHP